MVNKNDKQTPQDDVEITSFETEENEPELEEIENGVNGFNNTLRDKLKVCEAEKREVLEELQRAKADFLNAKKRLEEERLRDRERSLIKHIESLIPLCDSFQVAMSDKSVWEKADENWRKGIEGINAQLQGILSSSNVTMINPKSENFNPHQHEALSTLKVESAEAHDKVIEVVQMGYELKKNDGTTELIRPARVIIGTYEKN